MTGLQVCKTGKGQGRSIILTDFSKFETRSLWILETLVRRALRSSLLGEGRVLPTLREVGHGIVKWALKTSKDGDLTTE